MSVLWKFVEECLEKNSNSIIEEYNGARYSYAEFREQINKYGDKVENASYVGCKCIVVCRKSIESFMALAFCWRIGMVAVPMSLHYGMEQCKKIIKVIQPEFIITDDESIKLCDEIPVYSIDNFINYSQCSKIEYIPNIELMMCTSGTTGMPKASMLTGHAIVNNVLAISEYFPISNKDRILIERPLYHCAVLVGEALTALNSGTSIMFFSDEYNPIVLSRILRNKDITVMCGTPTIFKGLADYIGFQKNKGELQIIALSGEYLLPEYAKCIADVFVTAKIFNVYGLTEAGPRVTYLPHELFNKFPQSVGIPLRGIEIKILDENEKEKDRELLGNVWIKSPSIMLGYYRDIDETKERFSGEWFNTGDIGFFDQNGYLYIVGRSDDMIIRQGINIYPQEIERIILEIPDVRSAIVYGKIDNGIEQIYTDIILEKDSRFKNEYEIKMELVKIMPGYMLPSRVNIVEEFPKNASGKIVRPAKGKR